MICLFLELVFLNEKETSKLRSSLEGLSSAIAAENASTSVTAMSKRFAGR